LTRPVSNSQLAAARDSYIPFIEVSNSDYCIILQYVTNISNCATSCFTRDKDISYSLPSVGSDTDPGVQAVSPQATLSHPSDSRLPSLSARPAVTFPAEERHRLSASIKLYCLVTDTYGCEQLAQGCYSITRRPALELATTESPIRCLSHWTTDIKYSV